MRQILDIMDAGVVSRDGLGRRYKIVGQPEVCKVTLRVIGCYIMFVTFLLV